ncbi:hypothetical protein I551_6206 [Mycobacterium ulcerans str. Harvey]|uniref:Uncharacterized protein n=1 Tax=Mycobacterium ulcerans str. Harvey TaxID=1299332 RepID=A0ABN0QRV9_MYCUL|nr:hypothetical protein I551_6206 [Mycobacterium ulcerans str. Harvey]
MATTITSTSHRRILAIASPRGRFTPARPTAPAPAPPGIVGTDSLSL